MNELTEQVSNATFMTKLYQSDLCDVKIKYIGMLIMVM